MYKAYTEKFFTQLSVLKVFQSSKSALSSCMHVLQDSLLALNKLREEVDMEKSRSKCDKTARDHEHEICIRAKNNAWVITRITRGKELYMVLEKGEDSLLYALDAVEKFSNR